MRISDIALSTATPVPGARVQSRRGGDAGPAATVVSPTRTGAAPHPDELAASALQRAAGQAQANRVVAAQNELASRSVTDHLDTVRLP